MTTSFRDKLAASMAARKSSLCVGLDLDPQRMAESLSHNFEEFETFLRTIIDATAPYACCYKINTAYYEVHGALGWILLDQVRAALPDDTPLILDAKRGDVGHSSEMYAKALFETYHADAVTVSPLMGTVSIAPFLERRDRGVFVLCATSNPGAAEFLVGTGLHLRIAEHHAKWAAINRNTGLVVGATRPETVREVRALAPDAMILLPGIGAQGGDLESSLEAARGGTAPVIVAASRSILYASRGDDFAAAARSEAQALARRTAPYVDAR